MSMVEEGARMPCIHLGWGFVAVSLKFAGCDPVEPDNTARGRLFSSRVHLSLPK
jgi:hypothetical protein